MTNFYSNYNPAATRRARRRILISITVLTIACMALVHAVLPSSSIPLSSTTQAVATSTRYLAKAQGTQVAIYVTGSDTPAFLTDIDVRTLPQADREALAQGIALASEEALAHLLEDYGS